MNPFVHDTSHVEDCRMEPDSKIYQHCDVRCCSLASGASVGDFSRLSDCTLAEGAMLQRNAMAYGVAMGRHSYTGKNFTGWHSRIGAFCSLSWNVSVGGADHDYSRTTTHSFLCSPEFGFLGGDEAPAYDRFAADCVIGNDVWIAAGACICRGVRVGDGAVIGAGAVVTKDVEPYTIVAGVPAKPIKKRFQEEIIALLLQSRWWDFPDRIIRENMPLFRAETDRDTALKLLDIRKRLDTPARR